MNGIRSWRRRVFSGGGAARWSLPLALMALLGACSLPGREEPVASHTYLLQGSGQAPVAPPGAARKCLSLRVAPGSAAPGFATARMAYLEQAGRLDYFAYHEWVGAPAGMLSSLIVQALDTSGLFGAVISGSPEIRTDLRLDSELLYLRQDFRGSAGVLDLGVSINLVDVRNRSLLGTKRFDHAVATRAADPEAGVAAANRAADDFVRELVDYLAASIADIDCSAPG